MLREWAPPFVREIPVAAYFRLCKCRVILLMLVTTWVGMCLAVPGQLSMTKWCFATLGIALGAASGAVVNHVLDRQIDAIMQRTQRRPLVRGELSIRQASMFALLLGVLSMWFLGVWVNKLTAGLTFASMIGYAFIYTGWLKRATPQNIVIGGLAGAMPPLLGWTAVTGQIDVCAMVLVAIIFFWTPPHFWALAIYRYDDYAKTPIPMLPVTHGISYTKFQMIMYVLLLWSVTMLPYLLHLSGWLYLVLANVLNLAFLVMCLILKTVDDPWLALQTFRFSIIYLFVLFSGMLLDHYFIMQRLVHH